MEPNVICFIFACFSSALTQAQEFRSDYKYNPETDAFYKLHVGKEWDSTARDVCSREGAQLMVVSSNVDVAQALSMLEQYPDLEYARVGAETREIELPLSSNECLVITNTWKVQSQSCIELLPFICKVKASDVYYDSVCQVYGKDYKYVVGTGSCYRIPTLALTWDQAYDECNAQGAHLVIINSKVEDRAVLQIYEKSPNIRQISEKWWWFFAGFRANESDYWTSRVFRTVFNQTLQEAGFVNWEPNEPNNVDGVENCGAVFSQNGEFNDVNCLFKLPFICEKEIQ